MAKFKPAFDIWKIPADQYHRIQPGQWVYAGERANKGQFLGVRSSGTVVCAWYMNARAHGRGQFASYLKSLRQYATAT